MNLKEVFDQALAQCTAFSNSMDNARQEFEKHVNEIIAPVVENNPYFDRISCYIGYGRDSSPRIAMIQNSTNSRTYINVFGLTFKLKLERGQKHHSYYDDWYEYKVKAYTDIKVLGLDEEESALFFDTKDILELIQHVYNTDKYVRENVEAEKKYNQFASEVDAQYSELISKLTLAINEFKELDNTTQEYINNKLCKTTDYKIYNW